MPDSFTVVDEALLIAHLQLLQCLPQYAMTKSDFERLHLTWTLNGVRRVPSGNVDDDMHNEETYVVTQSDGSVVSMTAKEVMEMDDLNGRQHLCPIVPQGRFRPVDIDNFVDYWKSIEHVLSSIDLRCGTNYRRLLNFTACNPMM